MLSSAHSMEVSLQSIRCGQGGLDEHRLSMLNRVPQTDDWASFPCEHLTMKDLAYLTAKTGHEFAILRGKSEDVLFHGGSRQCKFSGDLYDRLLTKQLRLYGHSHPGEDVPIPSPEDRATLIKIDQPKSRVISGLSGREVEFSSDLFEII